MYKGFTYNANRNDVNYSFMKSSASSEVSSTFAKDDEIYDAVNIACEILNENQSRLSTADEDVLNDVIIDVNSLTQSEDSLGVSGGDHQAKPAIESGGVGNCDLSTKEEKDLNNEEAEETSNVNVSRKLIVRKYQRTNKKLDIIQRNSYNQRSTLSLEGSQVKGFPSFVQFVEKLSEIGLIWKHICESILERSLFNVR